MNQNEIDDDMIWSEAKQDWVWPTPVKPFPGRPLRMRIRFTGELVLYEPVVGTGGGIRVVPKAPSACMWMVPIAPGAAPQP